MLESLVTQQLGILVLTALSVGFFHTLLGPDHYIPFTAMAKAGNWSTSKTVWITVLCGIGHVGSSVVLGLVGIALGWAVTRLEVVESARGNIAGWLLIGFGFLYAVWGLRHAYRNGKHAHCHPHPDGSVHDHVHRHSDEHVHVHGRTSGTRMTPWVLFTVFVFGPCEPLIPILMYPAAQSRFFDVVVVSFAFGLSTIGTMVAIVLSSLVGLRVLPVERFERFSHALAGIAVFSCGIAVQFLGL